MANIDLSNYKKFVKQGPSKSKPKKVPVQPGSWLKNVTKSLGYAALETVGQITPNITEYAKSAAESSEAVVDAVKSAKSNAKSLQTAVSGNDYVQMLKEFKANAIADLKSGNFYNKARRDKFIASQMGGDDFDFDDMGFDDSGWETEGDFEASDEGASVKVKSAKNGESHVSQITMVNDIGPNSAIVQSTNFQTEVIAKGTEVTANTLISNNQALMSLMGKVGNDQVRAISTTTSTIADVGSQITAKLNEFASISEKYYSDSMSVVSETRDLLKEIRANTAAAASATLAARQPKQVNDIMGLIGSGGVLNLSEYKAFVKGNVKKWAESDFIASSIMSMLSEKDTLRDMIQQPLKFMVDGVINAAIPSVTKTILKSLDETVGEFVTTGLTQLGSLGNSSSNPLMSALGQIFGMKQEMKTSINKANYNKGAVAFDGITHKTINEVIPTYLRQITSVLTNREEIGFDYESGMFRTIRSMQEDYNNRTKNALLSPFGEDRAQFQKAVKESLTGASETELKDLNKVFDNMLIKIAKNGGLENYRKVYDKHGNMRDPLAELLNLSSDSKEVVLIRDFLESRRNLPGGNAANMRMFGSNVHAARRNLSNLNTNAENNPYEVNAQYIQNGLNGFTNTHMRLPKEGERSTVARAKSAGLGLDAYGKSQTDYLRSMLATLQKGLNVYVVNSLSSGGGGRRRGRGTSGGPSPFDYSSDIDKRNDEARSLARREANEDTTNRRYQRDLEEGKIDIGEDIAEGQFGSMVEPALEEDYGDSATKNRKASFLEKLSGTSGVIGKWAGAINKGVNKATGTVGTVATTIDNFLYNLLFGDGKTGGIRYMIDIATSFVVSNTKKAALFITNKILQPIDSLLFGENGLITRMKESDLFKDIKDRFKGAKDFFSEKIFGTKVEGPDGKVTYEGGLISDTMSAFSDIGNAARDMILGQKGPDGKPVPLDQDHSALGAIKRMMNSASTAISDKLGLGKDDGSTVTFSELAVNAMDDVWSRLKERSSFLIDNLFGKPSEGDTVENGRDLFDNFRNEMKGKGGKLIAGGILGAAATPIISASLGSIGSLFLPGGPLGAAILGAGISFVSQSETLKTKLFGPTDDNGERTGGLISKDFQDFFKNNKAGLAVGGMAGLASTFGLIPSMFVPGGPIGGALIGAGVSMVAKSQYMSDLLYGEGGTKDDPTGGIMEKFKKIFGKDKDLKGLALDGAIGAGIGIVGSLFLPGGPIIGAVLGAATSIITNTETFKKLFFGEEQFDENGNSLGRKGGIIGRTFDTIDNKIVTPLFKKIELAQADLMFFIKDKIFRNLAIAVGPITNKFVEAGEAVLDMSKALGKHVLDSFKSIVIAPVGKAFDTYVIQPMKTVSSMIFKTFTKVLGGIISAPFKLIGAIGMSIFENDKARGSRSAVSEARATRNENALSKLSNGDILGAITSFARGTVDVYRPSTRREGQFSRAGAGRYASATKNPETENIRIHNEAVSERDRRYAEIESKYASGRPLTGRALRKAKKNDPNYTVSSKIEQANETSEKNLTEVQDINDTVSKLANDFTESLSERRSFFDIVKNAFGRLGLGGINARLRGDESPQVDEGSPASNPPGSGGKRRYKVSSLARTPGIRDAQVKAQEEAIEAKTQVREVEASKVEAASDNLKQTGKREGIFNYVRKIFDNVDGNLNGVGYNINKIYALLLKEFKETDDDIKGGDNKKYLGLKGRMLKWLKTPIRVAQDVIMTPFRIVGGMVRGAKEAISGLVDGIGKAGSLIIKGVGGIANALLSIPGQLLGIFGTILKTGLTVVGETVKIGAKALTTAISVGGEILVSGIKGIGNFAKGLAEGLGKAGGRLISGLSKVAEGVMSIGGSLLKGLGQLGLGLMKGLGFVIKGGGKLIGAGASAVGHAVSGVAGKIFGKGGSVLSSKIQKVFVTGGTLDKVKVVNVVNNVKSTDLTSYINKLSNEFDNIKSKIRGAGGEGGFGGNGGFGGSVAARNVYVVGGTLDRVKGVGKVGEVEGDNKVPEVYTGAMDYIKSKVSKFMSPKSSTGQGTAEAIVAERKAEDEAAKVEAREDLQTTLLSKISGHTGKFATEFSGIFGKKGLIGAALIVGIPLLINFLRNFRIDEIIGKLVDGIANTISSFFIGSRTNEGGGNGNGLVVDENGNVVMDENGNLQEEPRSQYASGIAGLPQRALDLFLPRKTRIANDGSGRAETGRHWDNLSGATAMALGNRGLKWGIRGVRVGNTLASGASKLGGYLSKGGKAAFDFLANTGAGKAIGNYINNANAYKTAFESFTAAGIDDAAKMAAENVGGRGVVLGKAKVLAEKAVTYADDVARTGVEAIKASPVGQTAAKVVGGGKGVIQKFITIAKTAVDDLVKAVVGFAQKHGATTAALGPVQAAFKKVTSVLSESALGKFSKKIGVAVANFAAGLTPAAIANIAFAGIGFINANPAQIFQVKADDVDFKMQAIARLFKSLLSTQYGTILDVLFEIVNGMIGINIGSEICILLYNAISSNEKRENLKVAQDEFRHQYEGALAQEYEEYKAHAIETGAPYMEYGDYVNSELSTKFNEYNRNTNQTIGGRIMNTAANIGNGVKKGWTGLKSGVSSIVGGVTTGAKNFGTWAANGMKSVGTGIAGVAQQGVSFVAGGVKQIGKGISNVAGAAKDKAVELKDKAVDIAGGIKDTIGNALAPVFNAISSGFKTATDIGSIPFKMYSDTIQSVIDTGNMRDAKITLNENDTFYTLKKFLATIGKVVAIPQAGIMMLGKKIYDAAAPIVEKIKVFGSKAGQVVSENWQNTLNGQIPTMNTPVDPNDPTSYILGAVDYFSAMLLTTPAAVVKLGRTIGDGAKAVANFVRNFGPKVGQVVGTNWQNMLNGQIPINDTPVDPSDPTSYILSAVDYFSGMLLTTPASVVWLGKKIGEGAAVVANFVKSFGPRVGQVVGANWQNMLNGEIPINDTPVDPADPTSYVLSAIDTFSGMLLTTPAAVVWTGKTIGNTIGSFVNGVKNVIPQVGTIVSANWQQAMNGQIPLNDTPVDPAEPMSFVLSAIDTFSGSLFMIPASVVALGKAAGTLIKGALDIGKDIGGVAKKAANITDKNLSVTNYYTSGEDTSTIGGMINDLIFKVVRGLLCPVWSLFKGISSITGVVSDGLNWLMEKVGIGTAVETTSSEGGSGGRGGIPEQSKVKDGGYGPDYVSQNDPSLANQPYNLSNGQRDTFGNRGCGPAAMTMVANKMGGNVSPLDVAKDSTRGGYSTDVGTRKEFFNAEASKLGMNSSRMPASAENMKKQLGGYGPVIIQGQDNDPNSPFTSRGHYVVGNQVSNGMIDIDDPRGPQYSGLYPLDKVAKGATNMWAFGKKRSAGGYGPDDPLTINKINGTDASAVDSTSSTVTSSGAVNNLTTSDNGKCSPRKVVKIAAGEVGYLEKASGSQLDDKTANVGVKEPRANYTKYNQLVGSNPQYWCAAFVSWVFDKACDGNASRRNAVIRGGVSASCNALMSNFQKAGAFDKNPKIGDMIFFPGSRHGGANHIGIVVGIKGNIVYTIEGNTGGGAGVVDNGGGVFVKSYQLPGNILGFGHPNWEAESPGFEGITSADQAAAAATMTTSGDTATGVSTGYNTTSSNSSSSTGGGLMSILGSMASTLFGPLMKAFGLGTDSSTTSGTDLTTVADSTSGVGDYSGVQITGSDTKKSAFNFFRKLGYSAAAAAGILGNAEHESGCNPEIIQGHGKGPAAGFFQWESYRDKSARWKNLSDYAATKGKQWTDLQSQLEFADTEFKAMEPARWQYKNWVNGQWVDGERKSNIASTGIKVYNSLDEFKAADSPESAALSWQETFERPNFAKSNWKARVASARQFYDMYKDSTGGVTDAKDGNAGAAIAMNKKGQPISPKDSDRYAAELAKNGNSTTSTSQLGGMGGYGGTPTVPRSSIAYDKLMSNNGADNTRYKPVTPKPEFDIQKFAANGGFGDEESRNLLGQIKGVLDTIAGNTGTIGTGIDSLNNRPTSAGDTTNNITTVNNISGQGEKKTDTKKHSFVDRTPRDRSGYNAAKKLASGTLLAT